VTSVVCVSDLHENLPEIPECDVLCVAGDITFGFKGDLISQQKFIINEFADWTHSVPAKDIVVVAGNHDQCVERWGWPQGRGDQPAPRCHYLQDEGVSVQGLNIWGTPWQPYFHNWSFNAPERHGEAFLREKFAKIPDDTDIIICHGPPYGYGDQVGDPTVDDRTGQPHAGSLALLETVRRVDPKLMVCGHIHSGRGIYTVPGCSGAVVNCAHVNDQYQGVYPPVVMELA
jgi:Icc-related predicted phosphoesterase